MKLYVCCRTWRKAGPRTHPCGVQYEALKEVGYIPEVIRSYGLGWTVVQGSKRIPAWAQVHPARAGRQLASGAT